VRLAEGRTRQRLGPAGQGLVEFTLVIPIFLLILLGVFDAGRAVYMNTSLSQAAREGARVASVEAAWIGSTDPSCGHFGGPVCPASFDAMRANVLDAVNNSVVPFGPVALKDVFISCDTPGSAPSSGNWTTKSCSDNGVGNIVSVRVQLGYAAITPVIGNLIHDVTLSGSASMAIN
jgi:hypothetical protein